ncbi:hypothetical protein AVEN_60023-1 [Araneus ventricosus]|uniref:Uncharacterized protein n=1 Tax=Araneus ventricosus TaxID=182803 RepID=A0A4Y2CD01_ARAVE|nr:hypothetical protein AVEN_60023-1 [Araneus ventricosus]
MPVSSYFLLYLINPVLHTLVERLSPRLSSTGLAPFLGGPGQCGFFCATTTGGRLATTYDLVCSGPHARRVFGGVGSRAWSLPTQRSRSYH